MSVSTDRYKELAKDYLITKDMVLTYSKYHPNIKNRNVLEASASRLLSNVNFLRIKEAVYRELYPDLEANAKQCLQTLYELSQISEKQSDRIIAATNYLKFTMGEVSKIKNIPEDNEEFKRLRGNIFTQPLTASEN